MGALVAIGAVPVVGAEPASHAEGQPAASPAKQPAAGEPAAKAAPSRRARGRSDETREQWWAHAREVLLTDLVPSEDQVHQIDAIIERQIGARKRIVELQPELRAAQRKGDAERGAALRAKLRASRAELKDPAVLLEEMRAVLTEQQRPTFDMNRARLVAETQQAQQAQRRRPKRVGPGADAGARPE
jgi:hypothetical protein